MYQGSSQLFRVTAGIQSRLDFRESKSVITFLTTLRHSNIFPSFKFVLERQPGKEILESSRFRIKHLASSMRNKHQITTIRYQVLDIWVIKISEVSHIENINKIFLYKYGWCMGRSWVKGKGKVQHSSEEINFIEWIKISILAVETINIRGPLKIRGEKNTSIFKDDYSSRTDQAIFILMTPEFSNSQMKQVELAWKSIIHFLFHCLARQNQV